MKKETIIVSLLLAFFSISILLGLFHSQTPKNKGKVSKIISSKNSIALIYIDGPISAANNSPFTNNMGGINSIVDQLYKIEENSHIKAVVIRINSPGGTSGASQETYEEIMKFKTRTKIPVIISIADIAASGAYWIAMAGDIIFANPSSLVGSIGVIINSLNFSELAKKYGVNMTTIKSGRYKDMLSSWRDVDTKEKKLLQAMVDNVHSQFTKALAKSRNISLKKANEIADGRVFSGEQAKKIGLIDELGGLQDSIKYAANKVGIKKKRPDLIIHTKNPLFEFFNLWKSSIQKSFFSSLGLNYSYLN